MRTTRRTCLAVVLIAGAALSLAAVVHAQVAAGSHGPGPRASGFKRIPGAAATASSFSAVAGHTATRPAGLIELGSLDGPRARTVEFTPVGVGTAGQTGEFNVWAVNPLVTSSGTIEGWDQQLVGVVSFTLGNSPGITGGTVVLPTELVAETVGFTPAGYGSAMATAYGAGTVATVYTPGSGGEAVVVIRDLGNAFGVWFEGRRVTAATSVHGIVKTGT